MSRDPFDPDRLEDPQLTKDRTACVARLLAGTEDFAASPPAEPVRFPAELISIVLSYLPAPMSVSYPLFIHTLRCGDDVLITVAWNDTVLDLKRKIEAEGSTFAARHIPQRTIAVPLRVLFRCDTEIPIANQRLCLKEHVSSPLDNGKALEPDSARVAALGVRSTSRVNLIQPKTYLPPPDQNRYRGRKMF